MTRTAITPVAAASTATAAALAAWGTFGEHGDQPWGEYLAVLGIIAVGALAVFAWVVPRMEHTAGTGLVLSSLGVLAIAVFWSGLPVVLGAGGALLGWASRERVLGKAAVALGVLAIVADVVVYVLDMA
jgi:hypothetical protein